MTASNDITKYEEYWGPLFEQFNERPQDSHIVYCNSPREASAVRLEFYKARHAQQQSDKKLYGDSPETMNKYALNNLALKDARVVGSNVIFGYKNASRVGQLLKASLLDPRNKVADEYKEETQFIAERGNENTKRDSDE